MINILRSLLLRWLIFYKGIRFYETHLVPKSPGFKSVEFEAAQGYKVEFFFYKETCVDLIFKRGIIREETYTGYVIQAKFDEVFPEHLHKYNTMKFFFNGNNFVSHEEDFVVRRLMAIYLEHIHNETKKFHSMQNA